VAEVILALALITMVVLGLLGVSLYSMTASRKSRDVTAGLMVAEQVLDRMVYEAESTAGAALWTTNNAGAVYHQQVVTMNPSMFNVTIYVSDVAPATFAAGTRLKKLDGLVVWQDAPQGKARQGQLQIRATRLLHEP
jgi:Tfp pilus assembly protein PilV